MDLRIAPDANQGESRSIKCVYNLERQRFQFWRRTVTENTVTDTLLKELEEFDSSKMMDWTVRLQLTFEGGHTTIEYWLHDTPLVRKELGMQTLSWRQRPPMI